MPRFQKLANWQIIALGGEQAHLAPPAPVRRVIRCPKCGGRLMFDSNLGLGSQVSYELCCLMCGWRLDVTAHVRKVTERQVESVAAIEPRIRGCQGCGGELPQNGRVSRCRRCYLRERYRTHPEVRAKQLASQARWRRAHGLRPRQGSAA